MTDKISLTTGQQFEIERMSRAIDNTTNVDALRQMCKMLLTAWHTQKAASEWLIRQNMSKRP